MVYNILVNVKWCCFAFPKSLRCSTTRVVHTIVVNAQEIVVISCLIVGKFAGNIGELRLTISVLLRSHLIAGYFSKVLDERHLFEKSVGMRTVRRL